jgi:hypothetical protein
MTRFFTEVHPPRRSANNRGAFSPYSPAAASRAAAASRVAALDDVPRGSVPDPRDVAIGKTPRQPGGGSAARGGSAGRPRRTSLFFCPNSLC